MRFAVDQKQLRKSLRLGHSSKFSYTNEISDLDFVFPSVWLFTSTQNAISLV